MIQLLSANWGMCSLSSARSHLRLNVLEMFSPEKIENNIFFPTFE